MAPSWKKKTTVGRPPHELLKITMTFLPLPLAQAKNGDKQFWK
jgi:hypothetical protein